MPLTLALVLLSGIGPLIAWRRATAANLRRNFSAPIGVAVAALALALVLGAGSQPDALIMFVLAGFVLGAVGQELVRGVRARRVMAASRCRSRSSRWSGATGAATAATSCTPGWRCCSSASPPPRASPTSATSS